MMCYNLIVDRLTIFFLSLSAMIYGLLSFRLMNIFLTDGNDGAHVDFRFLFASDLFTKRQHKKA